MQNNGNGQVRQMARKELHSVVDRLLKDDFGIDAEKMSLMELHNLSNLIYCFINTHPLTGIGNGMDK